MLTRQNTTQTSKFYFVIYAHQILTMLSELLHRYTLQPVDLSVH